MNKVIIFVILFFLSSAAAQADINLRLYNNLYCYDGDTCYVTINGINTKIRLLELDTPEISKPKCEKELQLGLMARDYLNNRIIQSTTIKFETNFELDYFGRTLAHLIIDGKNISAELVSNQLGVIYKQGFKMDWCNQEL